MSRFRVGLVGAFAIAFLGVFAVPWLFPPTPQPIVSTAQAAGFSSGVAEIALLLAAVVAFFSADWHGRSRSYVRLDTGDGRLDSWVVVGAAAVTVVITVTSALLIKGHSYGEVAYFLDRLAYVANGNRPYVQFEFGYGPGLLYLPYVLWLALKPFGAVPAAGYYLALVVSRLLGVLMLAWVMNRLGGPRWLRTSLFLVVAALAAEPLGMGLEYTLVRYALGMCALLFIMARAEGERSGALLGVESVVAVLAGVLVSPEIGVAIAVALVAAFGFLTWRRQPGAAWALAVLAAACVLGAVALTSASTFMEFASGAAHLPVFPGPPALVYIGCMVIVAWASGAGLLALKPDLAASQVAWVVFALVMAVAALGRADFGHIFWNGLPALLVAPIVLYHWRPKIALAGLAIVGIVFLLTTALYEARVESPYYLREAVGAGTLTEEQALRAASLVGVPSGGLHEWFKQAPGSSPSSSQTAALLSLRGVAVPIGAPTFDSETEWALAERHQLAPSWALLSWYYTYSDAQKAMALMDKATYVALPLGTWEALTSLLAQTGGQPPAIQPWEVQRKTIGTPYENGYLYGLPPFTLPTRAAELNPDLVFGAYILNNWTYDRTIGPYAVLRKRAQ